LGLDLDIMEYIRFPSDNYLYLSNNEMTGKATHNSTLAIGGVSSPLDSFVVTESSVLRTNYCGKNHHYRLAEKRYLPF
jgi:hypothetical protein